MKIIKNRIFFLVFSALLSQQTIAQEVKRYEGKVSQQLVVNSSTVIIDRSTRKRISYQAYEQLIKSGSGKYKLEPVFDKFGKASSFMLIRRTSPEAPQVISFNEDLMPEVGEPLPPFIMQGLDGITYDSEKLKGKYVLLGFWIRYEKPLYTLASTKVISTFVDEHRKRGIEIVSLGTTLDTREECLVNIPKRNCGFIPVPESYGFNHRYHIAETPFFILLDKQGNVRAMAPHTEFSVIGDLILK